MRSQRVGHKRLKIFYHAVVCVHIMGVQIIASCIICLRNMGLTVRDKVVMCHSMKYNGDGIKRGAPLRTGGKLI